MKLGLQSPPLLFAYSFGGFTIALTPTKIGQSGCRLRALCPSFGQYLSQRRADDPIRLQLE